MVDRARDAKSPSEKDACWSKAVEYAREAAPYRHPKPASNRVKKKSESLKVTLINEFEE
jgi:hypothetical protein